MNGIQQDYDICTTTKFRGIDKAFCPMERDMPILMVLSLIQIMTLVMLMIMVGVLVVL